MADPCRLPAHWLGFLRMSIQRADTEVRAPATLLSDPFGASCGWGSIGHFRFRVFGGPFGRVSADGYPAERTRRSALPPPLFRTLSARRVDRGGLGFSIRMQHASWREIAGLKCGERPGRAVMWFEPGWTPRASATSLSGPTKRRIDWVCRAALTQQLGLWFARETNQACRRRPVSHRRAAGPG